MGKTKIKKRIYSRGLSDYNVEENSRSRSTITIPGPETQGESFQGSSERLLCYLANPTFRSIFIPIYAMKPTEPITQVDTVLYLLESNAADKMTEHTVACLPIRFVYSKNIY